MSENLVSILVDQNSGEALLSSRIASWSSAFRPGDAYQEYLVKEYAECTIEKERIKAELKITRAKWAKRLECDWDAYQRIATEKLTKEMSENPCMVREQLMLTIHGCEWMIKCWERLLAKWDRYRQFNAQELSLAYDLAGIPPALRGYVEDFNIKKDLIPRIRAEIEGLKDRKTSREGIDAIDRQAAISSQGLFLEQIDEIVDLNEKLKVVTKHERWLSSRLSATQREAKRFQKVDSASSAEDLKNSALGFTNHTTETVSTEVTSVLHQPVSSIPVKVGPAMVDALPAPEEPAKVVSQFPLPQSIPAAAFGRVVETGEETKWVGNNRPLTT